MDAMPKESNLIGKVNQNPWTQRMLRIILGALFFYAGYAKLSHSDGVADNLLALNLLPWSTVNFMAMWLVCFEMFIGVLVIAGFWLRPGSMLLIGFCVICLGLICYAIAIGLKLHCGCFVTEATGDSRVWGSLWQEILILLGCIWLFATTKAAPKKRMPDIRELATATAE